LIRKHSDTVFVLFSLKEKNHARVVLDGFLRDLPVSIPKSLLANLSYSRVEVAVDAKKQKKQEKQELQERQ